MKYRMIQWGMAVEDHWSGHKKRLFKFFSYKWIMLGNCTLFFSIIWLNKNAGFDWIHVAKPTMIAFGLIITLETLGVLIHPVWRLLDKHLADMIEDTEKRA